MARTKTTHDIFNAIAEPKRRALVEVMAGREMTVNELVAATRWNQPMVSKHLAVLKKVGIASERQEGRCRIYSIHPENLRPIQEWLCQFEKYWGGTMDQLENYLETIQSKGEKRERD